MFLASPTTMQSFETRVPVVFDHRVRPVGARVLPMAPPSPNVSTIIGICVLQYLHEPVYKSIFHRGIRSCQACLRICWKRSSNSISEHASNHSSDKAVRGSILGMPSVPPVDLTTSLPDSELLSSRLWISPGGAASKGATSSRLFSHLVFISRRMEFIHEL